MLAALQQQRLSVSFETMARCLPDHGQRPNGDYLVVTSVCRMPDDGTVQARLQVAAGVVLWWTGIEVFGNEHIAMVCLRIVDCALL